MSVTGDALFIGLILLGAFFTMFSMRRPNILLALIVFTIWFSMGMWLFFSDSAPIGVGETWKDIFAWCFVMLSFLPWVFQMDVEIKHEKQGKQWTRYGQPPEEKGPTEYEKYREKLFMHTRGGRRR